MVAPQRSRKSAHANLEKLRTLFATQCHFDACSDECDPIAVSLIRDRTDGQFRSLHRHALRQIPRLVDVAAAEHGDVIGQELQRDRP